MTVMLNAATAAAPVPAVDPAPAGEPGSAGTFAALLAQTSDGSAPEHGDGEQTSAEPADGSATSSSAAGGRPTSGRSRADEQPADSSQVLAALLPMLVGQAVPADYGTNATGSMSAAAQSGGVQPAGSVSGIGSLPEIGPGQVPAGLVPGGLVPGDLVPAGQVPVAQIPTGQLGVAQAGIAQVGIAQAGIARQASETQAAGAARPADTSAGAARVAGSAQPAGTVPTPGQPAADQPAATPAAGKPSGAAPTQPATAGSALSDAGPKPASAPGTGRAAGGAAPASTAAEASSAARPVTTGQPMPVTDPTVAQLVANASPSPTSPSGSTSPNGTTSPNSSASPNGTASSNGTDSADGTTTAAAASPTTQPPRHAPLDRPAGRSAESANSSTGDELSPVASHRDKATGPQPDAIGAVSLGQPDATTTPAVPSLPPADQSQPIVQPQLTIQPQPANQPQASQPMPTLAQPVAQQLTGPLLRLRASGDGSHSLTIALHPAELGPVNLHVKLAGDTMTIQLASTSESAHDALRDALPQLHRELQAAGLPSAGLSLELGGHAAGDSAGFATPERQPHAPAQPAAEVPAGKPESRPRRAESGLDRWL